MKKAKSDVGDSRGDGSAAVHRGAERPACPPTGPCGRQGAAMSAKTPRPSIRVFSGPLLVPPFLRFTSRWMVPPRKNAPAGTPKTPAKRFAVSGTDLRLAGIDTRRIKVSIIAGAIILTADPDAPPKPPSLNLA